MSKLLKALPVLLIAIIPLNGCGVYSFTGASINAETMSIQTFYNEATGGPPDLAQTFTENLRDYFLQNTSLSFVPDNGELQMEGSIVSYRLSPVAPTSSGDPNIGDQAALTRLTIAVKVTYYNTLDPEFDMDRTFSFFADYDNNIPLDTIEEGLIAEIFDQIILDIFNSSVANW